VPQQIGAQTVQLAYAPMAPIEDFKPVQPIRRPRQHLGSGCFRLLLRAAVGFFGGAAVVIAVLFVLNALFPPPRLNILLLGRRLLQPDAWPRLPLLYLAIQSSVDTNLTRLEIIRALPTLIAVGPDGIDRRVIEGAMVQPYTTTGGASVQLPVVERINPVLLEIFGE
jgi:hypothetical protein